MRQGNIRHAFVAIAMGLFGSAHASVVMNGTRYIYPSDAREITVKVSNVGKVPALTQAWIDDGDAKSTPETVDVPFNLTPPLSRVEVGKSQTLRVAYTGADLPADRESAYWLNILEVPPQANRGPGSNTMQLAIRYRLKLFFRPHGLDGSSEAAPSLLTWARAGDGKLSVTNPSPFYVSFNDVKAIVGGSRLVVEPFSVAPRATVTFEPKGSLPASGDVRIEYQFINDYGGFISGSKAVGAP